MTEVEYMTRAAKRSQDSASLWFRYLGKVITEEKTLAPSDADEILASEELNSFQRVALKLALDPQTVYHEYVVGLSRPAKIKSIEQRLTEYGL
jgi:hypothetical protein